MTRISTVKVLRTAESDKYWVTNRAKTNVKSPANSNHGLKTSSAPAAVAVLTVLPVC